MKYTPGPWENSTANGRIPIVRRIRRDNGEADTFGSVVQSVSGPMVCRLDFGYGHKNDEANARLIAAAPDLLEACKLALDLFAKGHAIDSFDWGRSILKAENIRELNETPGKLRLAIEKAEGRIEK